MERVKKAKRYDETFKREAVALLAKPGARISEVAKGLGITPWTLRLWREKIVGTPEAPVAMTPLELERENRRLRAQLFDVTEQRDILKKACSILSAGLAKGMQR